MILDNEDILIDNIFSENIIEPIIDKITKVQPLDEKEENILKNHVSVYKFCSVERFKQFIRYIRDNNIYHHLNLNWINTSEITNMSYIFAESNFNGDISKWDTGNVFTMEHMFRGSNFNGDISKWNVSKVENMDKMFQNSQFNKDISKWDVSSVKSMVCMFFRAKFNKDISQWNTCNVIDMHGMFYGSNFNGDISKWDVSKVKNMDDMFANSNFNRDISNWNTYNLEFVKNIFNNSKFTGDISKWDLSFLLSKTHELSVDTSKNHHNCYAYYEEFITKGKKTLEYDYIELTNEFVLSKLLNIDCSNNMDIIENAHKIPDMIDILERSIILLDIKDCARLYNIPEKFIKHFVTEKLPYDLDYLCTATNLKELSEKLYTLNMFKFEKSKNISCDHFEPA